MNSGLELVPAKPHHVLDLRGRYSCVNLQEWRAVDDGKSTLEAEVLRSLLRSTLAYSALEDGKAFLMVGVCPAPNSSAVGYPWSVMTQEEIIGKRNDVWVLHRSMEVLAEMLTKYDLLEVAALESNKGILRWLEWIGFAGNDKPFLVGDQSFRLFWKKKG